jgi:hypothetical protein
MFGKRLLQCAMGFNFSGKENFIGMTSIFTLEILFKKLVLIQLWCSIKEDPVI